jgi:hypothetical protein
MFFSKRRCGCSSHCMLHWLVFCSAAIEQIENLNLPSIELGTNHSHRFRRWGQYDFFYLTNSYSAEVKTCGRTTQFSAALHCQAETSAGQSSLRDVLRPASITFSSFNVTWLVACSLYFPMIRRLRYLAKAFFLLLSPTKNLVSDQKYSVGTGFLWSMLRKGIV